jgi:phenylacetate-CoA ligase
MDMLLMIRLLHAVEGLHQHDRWSRRQLLVQQDDALASQRVYAYALSPFYQRFHNGLMGRPLHELPVLTKAMLMEHFDELATDRSIRLAEVEAHMANLAADARFHDRYWVNATSGSSGKRGIFLFDQAEWLAMLASFARAHEWAGARVNLMHRMKMASVASVDAWHLSARVGASLASWWMPALRLAANEPLATIVERLNTFQPDMLVAYASMARVLADEQMEGRLHIRPRMVFTSSEVLTAETRRWAEAAWGKTLFDQYAATETGGLAAECEHHRLHFFEDQVIVEVVDAGNRPVPPGVYGEKLLVTTLFSRTQPLIRYEINDSVRLAQQPCPCGRPYWVVDSIQGRREDTLRFPGTAGGEVAIHPNVFHQLLDTVPASGWQVVQAPDGVTVLLSGIQDPVVEERLAVMLRSALNTQGVDAPTIRVQRVAAIPQTAAGKAPLIKAYQQ